MKRNLILALVGCALVFVGCSDSGPTKVPTETGGANGAGGLSGAGETTTTGTGGAAMTGGASATVGSVVGTGGAPAGGVSAAGGTSQTGGTSTAGGTLATGGTSNKATGGASATGGLSAAGGASQTGGRSATGGSLPTGGTGAGGRGGSGAVGGSATGGTVGGQGNVKIESTVPSQYGNPVANPGKWTSTTYPCYYHGSGSVGQVLTRQATPITKPVNIYTPPGYDPQIQYPLAFFLHGYPDNQNTWMERARIKPNVLLDNLIAAKVIKPIIAVWPMGSSTGNSGDTGGYMVFDNEMMNDLIPFIESKYSVKKDRDSRLISGFSYGGMQTINVFLCHHLRDFGWFAGYSPAGGNYDADGIGKCLQPQEPTKYPVNYFYVHTGANELATNSAKASAEGLTTKAAPTITPANFTFLTTGGGHDYDNCNIGLYNIVRVAFRN